MWDGTHQRSFTFLDGNYILEGRDTFTAHRRAIEEKEKKYEASNNARQSSTLLPSLNLSTSELVIFIWYCGEYCPGRCVYEHVSTMGE